ncbi:SGNH/GDSL hydrolase family protein [Paenibacillus flagellatus]|nr:GDSL-type esterase/lipase family protein [Paenibacillus flagellatus]
MKRSRIVHLKEAGWERTGRVPDEDGGSFGQSGGGFVVPVSSSSEAGYAGSAIRLALPFGVVIGDSIAEGKPETHGRLRKDGEPGFDPERRNVPGQLSGEFGALTGMHWFNHGIGGQRTDQIWGRWRRDALGESYDPADGRGDRTLSGQAYAVFVVAGINDVFQLKEDAFIQEHLLLMARDARDRGIVCLFSDLGEHDAATPDMRDQIVRINRWMRATLPGYGAAVLDFYEWSMDRSRGFGVNPAHFVDDVHPSRAGYRSLAAHYASQWEDVPLVPQGLELETDEGAGASIPGYGRPASIAVGHIAYGGKACGSVERFGLEDGPRSFVRCRFDGEATVTEIRIEAVHGQASCSGFSQVRAVMGSR